jgi:uncharacterized membrane protein SpoIIM required for sporulation
MSAPCALCWRVTLPPTAADSNAAAWIRARAGGWQALAAEAVTAAHRSRASPEEALRTMQAYRTLARNLANARQLLPGSFLTTALESACATLHVAIGRPPRFGRARLLTLFRDEIPAAAASVRATTLWIAALLAASVLAGWWLVSSYPALVSIIASDRMIDGVEHGHLWTDQLFSLGPPELLSVRIFSNNVVVTLGAFCSGILFGLGAFYMISFNGLMLGGLLAFTHQHGLAHGLVRFILAHGPVELSVMCLAAAAGTALGESIIRPQLASRGESLRRRGAELGPLLIACALLLFGSGLIEGFISPSHHIGIPVRLAVGLGYWTLMLLLLSGRLFPANIRRTASMSSASATSLSSR